MCLESKGDDMLFNNPLAKQFMSTWIRYVLIFASGYLVKSGIWTEAEADTYIAQLVEMLVPVLIGLAAAGWGTYKTYIKEKARNTAQALPAGVTAEEVKVAMNAPSAPPATLPADVAPRKMGMGTTLDTSHGDAA
jgi:hypothetical protein